MILDDLRQPLDGLLQPWAQAQGLDRLPAYTLEEPPAGIDADLACNLALLLAKPLKKSPRAVAEDLLRHLNGKLAMVESMSIAGAGFLNFRLTLPSLHAELGRLLQQGERYGRSAAAQDKILIEFVSANPTGPLHVGHGRGAALGDSLALILSHMGHTVTREYYINDAGNQVQMLGESLLARTAELEGKPFSMPEQGYHGDYVREMAKDYAAGTPADRRTPESAIAFALARMQAKIDEDLAAFGVRFDSWFSEAGLVKKGLVEKHIELLQKRGFVQEYDGATWFVSPGESDEGSRDKDRVLKRKDGRWTYFATDIAYHADKYERGFARLIDVWGADHHGYVPRVKGSMQALGYDAGRLHVILNQLVSLTRNGVPVAMSKRSGEFITLRDVVDEVGRDACRFFFALRGPNTSLDFDLELAKKQTADNPVYYLQYAHARICSIFHKVGASLVPARESEPARESHSDGEFRANTHDQSVSGPAQGRPLQLLKEKEERQLIMRLAMFPHILAVCEREDSPHPLANYLLSLGRQFHYFYDHHRVLGVDPALTEARLALINGVRKMLKLGLSLLGVSAPESM